MGNISSHYGVNRRNEVGNGRGHRDFSNGYAYGNTLHDHNGEGYGIEGGFGLNSGLLGDKNGWNMQSNLMSAYGFLGARSQKEADGSYSAWHGFGAKGEVAKVEGGYGTPGEGWYGQVSGTALSAEARSELNPNRGYEFGLGADLVSGDISMGHLSASSQHDATAKFGVGLGVGGGFGAHWADEDGDGVREIGINGSIALGPGIGFDLRSETLGHVWNGIEGGYNYLSENGGQMWDSTTDWVGNTWDNATNWAGNTWDNSTDAIASGVSSGWSSTTDAVSSGVSTATDWVSDTASSAAGWMSDTASSVGESVSEGWSSTTDAVGDFFSGW